VQTQEALDNAITAVDSLKANRAGQAASGGLRRAYRVAQQAVTIARFEHPFAGIVVSKDAQVGEIGKSPIPLVVDLRERHCHDCGHDSNEMKWTSTSRISRGWKWTAGHRDVGRLP